MRRYPPRPGAASSSSPSSSPSQRRWHGSTPSASTNRPGGSACPARPATSTWSRSATRTASSSSSSAPRRRRHERGRLMREFYADEGMNFAVLLGLGFVYHGIADVGETLSTIARVSDRGAAHASRRRDHRADRVPDADHGSRSRAVLARPVPISL